MEGSFADVKECKKKKENTSMMPFCSSPPNYSRILARRKKDRFTCLSVNFTQKDDLDLCGDRFTLIID